MPKFPFSSKGVNEKQQELYALSDTDLFIEVKKIQNDLVGWLEQSFVMSQEQIAYLLAISAADQLSWGAQIGAVVSTRGPVIMPNPPRDYGPANRTKQTKVSILGETSYTPPISGIPKIQGKLKATIEFTLVPW